MAYEFDTTVLGGLPVTIGFTVYTRNNRDVGLGNVGDVDEWFVKSISGRKVRDPKWLYKRLDATGESDTILNECLEYLQ